ncbi:hypothetical protein ACFPRL_08005 [Pseudoclavibacter helvolus]
MSLEERDDRFEAERKEERGADVGEDRAQGGDHAPEDKRREHADRGDEAEPERILDAHAVFPLIGSRPKDGIRV